MVMVTEKPCRSALTSSRIPGMDYCLNPYAGCSHGCRYCYACFMRRFLGTSDPWGTFVQVKTNFPERLAAQLRRCRQGRVMLSSVTDPYQPLEETYRLTRSCLRLLKERDLPVSILTKSDLIIRDIDLLREMRDVTVGFTITTADDGIAAVIEPGAPSPSRRFDALSALSSEGIRTWVFIAPVIPGISDAEEALSAILERTAAAGAGWVEYDPLNCYPAVVANMRSLFSEYWPHLLPRLEEACGDPPLYRERLRHLAERIWPRYGYSPVFG
jgi:DNA repair photolyase